ncbi:hypothetical protein SLS62_007704 [Diatrype stigma]|uniref:DNA polymerase epsilon subunit D n=1 Tax=Diatrype stigma TaxID=117547 RepID=A0AAN9ULJ1_9PEZI
MPPRKSDPVRRSDTTNAQFVLKDDVETTRKFAPASSSPAHVPAVPAAAAAPATTATEMETDRPSESVPPTDREKKEGRDAVTIESIITRLAKGVLPPNTQIQTNAVLAMSKSATVFINHLASAANEHTKNANKKTIMPADVFAALDDIEFPFLRESLEAEFKKFNEVQTTKRNTYRRKVAAAKAGKPAPEADAAAGSKSTGAATSGSKNTSDPDASTATASEPANATPRSKKQKPNGPDDSQMDVDGGANEGEERDPSDADTESEQEQHEDDEEDEGQEDEDEDEEEDEDENDHTMQETIEEKDGDDDDEALDNGADSD